MIHTLVTEEASPPFLALTLPWLIYARSMLASGIRDALVTVSTLPAQSTPENKTILVYELVFQAVIEGVQMRQKTSSFYL